MIKPEGRPDMWCFRCWMRWFGFEQLGCAIDEIVRHTFSAPVLSAQVLYLKSREKQDS